MLKSTVSVRKMITTGNNFGLLLKMQSNDTCAIDQIAVTPSIISKDSINVMGAIAVKNKKPENIVVNNRESIRYASNCAASITSSMPLINPKDREIKIDNAKAITGNITTSAK